MAAELDPKVSQSANIDGALGETARADIKVMVKRILRKHGYPPDLQDEAVKTVLAQAELLCAEWSRQDEQSRISNEQTRNPNDPPMTLGSQTGARQVGEAPTN